MMAPTIRTGNTRLDQERWMHVMVGFSRENSSITQRTPTLSTRGVYGEGSALTFCTKTAIVKVDAARTFKENLENMPRLSKPSMPVTVNCQMITASSEPRVEDKGSQEPVEEHQCKTWLVFREGGINSHSNISPLLLFSPESQLYDHLKLNRSMSVLYKRQVFTTQIKKKYRPIFHGGSTRNTGYRNNGNTL